MTEAATVEKKEEVKDPVVEQVEYWKARGYDILVILLPLTGEHVYKRFMGSMLAMTCGDAYNVLLSRKIKPMIHFSADFPIDHNRNSSVDLARKLYGAKYIMQFDTDMTFQADTIFEMLDAIEKPAPDGSEVEIISGMYFGKQPPFRPVGGMFTDWEPALAANVKVMEKFGMVCSGSCGDKRHKTRKGKGDFPSSYPLVKFQSPHYWPDKDLFRVDVIGVGCVLSRATMWDKLTYPYFDYAPNVSTGQARNFAREVSEDMIWCAKMHTAGIKVWMHPGIKCGHIGVLESNKDLWEGHFKMFKDHVSKMKDDDPRAVTFNENILDMTKVKIE